ncbi:hypothetical protein LXM94_05670 [Rhizobium sp. TRM95111]|uniref:hypothetical protein n=1 Tax=Rhizobium alarense TaxID=2846851 RepID=UPI001F2B756F|nr:hypothetical protein [Rhizobium alarense]MCF3639453.1 hypothetical protein [Rhizobium alarense]
MNRQTTNDGTMRRRRLQAAGGLGFVFVVFAFLLSLVGAGGAPAGSPLAAARSQPAEQAADGGRQSIARAKRGGPLTAGGQVPRGEASLPAGTAAERRVVKAAQAAGGDAGAKPFLPPSDVGVVFATADEEDDVRLKARYPQTPAVRHFDGRAPPARLG